VIVQNLKYADSVFSGNVGLGSGGVKFLPGKPVSGVISDGTDADTLAVAAFLVFENNAVQGFAFQADTLRINLSSFLELTAQNFKLDTTAAADEPLVSFTSVGAKLKIGGLEIGGEARNFAFLGDGSFDASKGFGVFLTIGGAPTADSDGRIGCPSRSTPSASSGRISTWIGQLPVDPLGERQRHQGLRQPGVLGSIEGIRIDIGLLAQQVPDRRHRCHRRGVKATCSAASSRPSLWRHREDRCRRPLIDTLDLTTPIEARVMYMDSRAPSSSRARRLRHPDRTLGSAR
jgi:hypothetical protein